MTRAPKTSRPSGSAPPDELTSLLFADARAVTLEPQQPLFTAGDPGDGCALLDEGLLKVHMISSSGGERILAILGPGALVGELAMIDGAPRSASVSAIRASKLRVVSRKAFDGIAAKHPQVWRHLTTLLSRRLREIDGALTAGSLLPLKGRTAAALLGLSEAFGKDVGGGRILISQKFSQSDLAGMAGIARENVSRILQDWMKRKLVSRLAGYYCIENRKALEQERDL